MSDLEIVWTKVDEAPGLATYSLLPIVEAFVATAGVKVKLKDISLTGRIIANFPEKLKPEQKIPDELAELGKLTLKPEANIIKLPNISASIPQLKAEIKELQSKGYDIPNYPDSDATPADKEIRARYGKVLGSAVNPVLREGNSDRRAAGAVKQYARKHPHKMGAWSKDSKTRVAHMTANDFYGSEVATTLPAPTNARIELVAADGATTVLKPKIPLKAGEIIDCSVMSARALNAASRSLSPNNEIWMEREVLTSRAPAGGVHAIGEGEQSLPRDLRVVASRDRGTRPHGPGRRLARVVEDPEVGGPLREFP